MSWKNKYILVGTVLAILIAIIAFFGASSVGLFGLAQNNDVPLRIGWQSAWAENGYFVEPLKNTDVLLKNSLDVDFVPFVAGVQMLEPAAAKQLDVMFLGTPVTAVLFSKSDDWVVVSKMADFPIFIMAGKNSGIKNIMGLRGKKIGVPFGSGPYAMVLQTLKSIGLNSKTDVILVNLKPTEFAQSLSSGSVDAVSWSEPTKATLEASGLANEIYRASEVGVVLVSKDVLNNHPEKVRALINSLKESEFYFAQNKEQVFNWYTTDSSLDLALVKSTIKIDPNYDANSLSQINLGISDESIAPIQERFDLLFSEGAISKQVIFKDHLDLRFVR